MSKLSRAVQAPRTVAELLFPDILDCSDSARQELEALRIKCERQRPIDPGRFYTSMWPVEQKRLLLHMDPQRYFDGLPLFAKEWIRRRYESAAAKGKLDNMPESLLKLYVNGGMRRDTEGPTR